jgi:hypothetical protein
MESMRKRVGACLMALLVAVILMVPLEALRGQDKRAPELRPLNSNPITVRMIGQTPHTLSRPLPSSRTLMFSGTTKQRRNQKPAGSQWKSPKPLFAKHWTRWLL